MDDYKNKWLDILGIDSFKQPSRSPEELVDTIAKVTNNPDFVRRTMQDWKECKITKDELHEKLKNKFGEATFKKIEKTAVDWQDQHQQ